MTLETSGMASAVLSRVELGFVEKEDPFLLQSWNFPSKIGGKPAWLSLSPIPNPEDVVCRKCGKSLVFLLQVYSPDSAAGHAFHRILFVFICRDPRCSSSNSSENIKVFRCQLPRHNDFYSPEPPNEKHFKGKSVEMDMPCASKYQPLCCICGGWGPKRCGKCKKRNYCGEEHQKIDWKYKHKIMCSADESADSQPPGILFKEFELVTEPEEYGESPDKSDEEKQEEYREFLKSIKPNSLPSLSGSNNKDLDAMAKTESQSDKFFLKFRERVASDPEQVLRYQRGGTPLWITDEHIPKETDILDCQCGSKRTFEFQVLPQLLNHLEVDRLEESIDWGVICVYTCSASCDIGNNYKEEFVWKQDIVDQN